MLGFALLSRFACSVGTATNQAEDHPKLNWQQCTSGNSCSQKSGSVVLDSNWRWVHDSGYTNCYDGNTWSSDLCPDEKTCSDNCYLDGADYPGTYGVSSNNTAVTLKFVTDGSYSKNIGSRLYLLQDESNYEMFKLQNAEFTFSVDVSQLPCGLNGALYFVEMDQDGGMKKYPDNKAGAKYGTGYCDAQCPSDLKFINGLANVENWKGQDNDENSGNGRYGACCAEMDIWESNSQATAYTAHPCTVNAEYRCDSNGKECGGFSEGRDQGVCDQDGCDFNSYRMGDKTFFGEGLTVDSKKPMTVVTQFVGSPVTEIKRKYVQGGKVIDNSASNISGVTAANSLTDTFCKAVKTAFGDQDAYTNKGGMAQFAKSLGTGMVLVLSLWDDHSVNMLWLDSSYPTDKSGPGVERGPCPTSSGVPKDVESQYASASVIYGDIKFGPIDSTYQTQK